MTLQEQVLQNEPPVKLGDLLKVIVEEKAKEDYFIKEHGYIIFLKKVPEEAEGTQVLVRVTAVKDRFGFAEFIKVL